MTKMNGINQLVRSRQSEWSLLEEEGVHGVYVKPLLHDDSQGRSTTFLLRFEPGATYPLHNHPSGEEVFVLEGDVRLGKDELAEGDYLYTAANNKHRVSTRGGCVLLLKVPERVEIINAIRE
jgi:quercetin dioxygenase-like cupin family protein